MIKKLILFLLFLLIVPLCSETLINGTIDLRHNSYYSRKGYTPVQGSVPLYWEQFLSFSQLQDTTVSPTTLMTIPGIWNNVETKEGKLSSKGYCTFVIKVIPPVTTSQMAIKLPAIRTAYTLYMDSTLLTSVGTPHKSPDQAVPQYQTKAMTLPRSEKPFHLIFHVSNFDNNKGGPWRTIYIGDHDKIFSLRKHALAYDLFLMGALLFFVFINATTYKFSETQWKRRAIVALTAFTLAIVIRSAVTGERFFYFLFPYVRSVFFVQLEYLSIFAAGIFFHLYIHHSLEEWSSRNVRNYVIFAGLTFSGIVMATPLSFYSQLIPLYQVNVFLIMFYQLVTVYRSRNSAGNRSIMLLLSIILLFVSALHDTLSTFGTTNTSLSFAPLGNMAVVLLQTGLLILEHAFVVRQRSEMGQRLTEINKTLNSFVPTDVFHLLGTTTEEVTAGIQKECNLTILVADIRNFTALSERMSPEMNFSFINRFLEAVTPCISKHNGFINNFVGDAFVAVFTGSPVQAVQAAMEIQKELTYGELFSPYMIEESIRLGIGIEYGPTTLGIMGGNTRMESILMGDVVTNASRLEELTKHTGTQILISENIRSKLPAHTYITRHLGHDFLRNETSGNIYELFTDNDSPNSKRKRRTQKQIEQAVHYMKQKRYEPALEVLNKIPSEVAHHDEAIAYLKDICIMNN